jgi:drug/metabolite transporter (DMT)-like permease
LALLWLSKRRRVSVGEFQLGIVYGVILTVIFLLETYGVDHTSATNAGLIISTAIVLTPLLDSVASRHWLPAPFFVATVVAVVGVGLLVSSHGLRAPTIGDGCMLAAAFVRALHVTLSSHLTRGRTYDTVFLTLMQCGLCALVFSLLGGSHDLASLEHYSGSQWFGLLFLGLACSVLGFLVQLWAVRSTSASRASLLLGTEPLWAVVVAMVIGHESMTALGVVGGLLIIGSTYVAQASERRHRLTNALDPVLAND